MARKPRPAEGEPALFDLPFPKESDARRPERVATDADDEAGGTLPLFAGNAMPPPVAPVAPDEDKVNEPAPAEAAAAPAAPERRLRAGLADLGVVLAVGAVAWIGVILLGVEPEAADWPAGGVFLLAFSFLYCVLPLAFWGRTPGMAWLGIQAHGEEGLHLTVGQAVRRWLGAVITVAAFGLPLLLCLTGGSLADRMSRSRTLTIR